MKITAISDLHGDRPKLEGGDLLIIAGDLTARDTLTQYQEFCYWMHNQPYERKVIIGGNHDMRLQKVPFHFEEAITGVSYLLDSGTEISFQQNNWPNGVGRGIKDKRLNVWGTPWTRWFEGVNPDCTGFMLHTEFQLKDKFDLIPEDTDILVTHGPCFGRLDHTLYGDDAGSTALRDRVDYLRGKVLRLHIHGHIHEAYGRHEEGGLITLNVARMTRAYYPGNKIVNIEI